MPQEKLKEKEREVRKRKEREEQELERVRVKARRKDAVSAYQALLTEKIKDAEVISISDIFYQKNDPPDLYNLNWRHFCVHICRITRLLTAIL